MQLQNIAYTRMIRLTIGTMKLVTLSLLFVCVLAATGKKPKQAGMLRKLANFQKYKDVQAQMRLKRQKGKGKHSASYYMEHYAKIDSDGFVYALDGNGKTCEDQPRQSSAFGSADSLMKKARTMVSKGAIPSLTGCVNSRFPQRGCYGQNQGTCGSSTKKVDSLHMIDDDYLDDYRLIVANGIPDHCYQNDQIRTNPNVACEKFTAMLVKKNIKAERPTSFTETPMGPVGISTSGAFLFNHKADYSGCNIAAITEKETFDPCDGHASPTCEYHYHKAPICIPGYKDCKLMGYLLDGVPMYGICSVSLGGKEKQLKSCYRKKSDKVGCDAGNDYEYSKTADCDLDEANGYYFEDETTSTSGVVFPAGSYVYFATPEYPFMMPQLAHEYDREALCQVPAP